MKFRELLLLAVLLRVLVVLLLPVPQFEEHEKPLKEQGVDPVERP